MSYHDDVTSTTLCSAHALGAGTTTFYFLRLLHEGTDRTADDSEAIVDGGTLDTLHLTDLATDAHPRDQIENGHHECQA